MHPVLLMIGNIASNICMKATTHTWSCIVFMSIPKFETHPDYHSILQAKLWHKCMDRICINLKVTAQVGKFIPDCNGYICCCFTPLIAYQGDLPEQ